ncbi:MAG: hypothetical protein IJY11_03650 [Clostridia bacterium]|nr:hypothetical protein [Clostridia bacterium]
MGTLGEKDHSGHRQRLIKKLERENLFEHELLELLLFYVFKRRNTNDLAHRLLAEFGSIRKILLTDPQRLQEVEGIGEQAALFLHVLGLCVIGTPQSHEERSASIWESYDAEAFIGHVRDHYENLEREVLDFYLLDGKGEVCSRRRFLGDEQGVSLEPTVFTEMILQNLPSGIIAVHNHPSGNLTPSIKDNEMTRICQLVCSFHNVLLCDHVIVTKSGMYSYYSAGEMKRIFEQYSINKVKKIGLPDASKRYLDDVPRDFPNVFKKDLDKATIEKRDGGYVGVIKD